ncbi:hypothetical protein [Micromonospora craniellae]|uniref:Uncharacterized protein n=1 Tax=Micromonospora craniellae TaxID=2294034 RepID=A0A372FX68_9ACTN|nr:hypothetical protein [Micromonospora craniellae]QOC90092.1 hypothetical protein ID554_17980 [Micromonospora craniellae]RFS45288.1 hypothetical protein D0Q02_17890 [Micromonospora craniellae]
MSGAVQTGFPPPAGPRPPAPEPRWPRWLIVATVAWAVLLAGLTWVSARKDPPTVREQRTLAEAGPVVDAAIGELIAASWGAVPALVAPDVDRGCRITPFADGAELVRAVDLAVPVGEERAALQEISDRLPTAWRAGVRVTSEGPRLRADAGDFVTVQGRPVADGRIRLTVDTGCRLVGDDYTAPGADTAGAEAGAEAGALAEALRALGSTGIEPEVVVAPCPGGGLARTVRSAAGALTASPQATLAPLAGGTPVVDTGEVYAFRRDGVAVLADLGADEVVLSATTGCAG